MGPRPSAFGVRARAVERAHVVAPSGDLDLFTAGEVQAALRARPEACDVVVLDLAGVTFLDTSGVRLTIETLHELDGAGVRFAVLRADPEVHRLFTLTRLDERLPFFDDLDAALAA